MFSAMLICGKSAYFWKTVFSWRRFGGRLVISCPSKITLPLSGVVKPPRMRSVVVLPQPEGPSRVTKEFSGTVRFKSSSTISPSKDFEMCLRSTSVDIV